MGIEEKYRPSTLKKEIIDSLIDIHIESSPVLIWQNEGGIRNVTKARIEAIDFASDSILLTPFSNSDEFLFNSLKINTTFYLRGNSKNIVFKQEKSAKKTVKRLHETVTLAFADLQPVAVYDFDRCRKCKRRWIGYAALQPYY